MRGTEQSWLMISKGTSLKPWTHSLLANAFSLKLNVLNESQHEHEISQIVVPSWQDSPKEVFVHRKGDHYNGIAPLNVSKGHRCQNKHLKYDSSFLKTLQDVKQCKISRCTRKKLFRLRIWKPRVTMDDICSSSQSTLDVVKSPPATLDDICSSSQSTLDVVKSPPATLDDICSSSQSTLDVVKNPPAMLDDISSSSQSTLDVGKSPPATLDDISRSPVSLDESSDTTALSSSSSSSHASLDTSNTSHDSNQPSACPVCDFNSWNNTEDICPSCGYEMFYSPDSFQDGNDSPDTEVTDLGSANHIPVRISKRISQVVIAKKDKHQQIQRVQVDQWNLPTVLNANAQSLPKKKCELVLYMREHNVGFGCITESWCPDAIPNKAVKIDNYNIERNNRNRCRGGGVLSYIHESIPHKKIEDLLSEEVETLWIRLNPPRLPRGYNPIVIGSIYHPPKSDDWTMLNHIMQSLDWIKTKYQNAGLVLMGDFNTLPTQRLKQMYSLKQLVTKPTHENSTLDLIFTNMGKFYSEPVHLPPLGKCKHQVIVCSPHPSFKQPVTKKEVKIVRSYSQNSKAMFGYELKQVDWTPLFQMEDVEEQYQFYSSMLQSLLDSHFPFKQVVRRENDKPWITEDFLRLLELRNKAWARKDKESYKFYRNKADRQRDQLQKTYYKAKISQLQDQPKEWWKELNNIIGKKDSSNPWSGILNAEYDGNEHKLAERFNQFFQSITANMDPLDTSNLKLGQDIDVPDQYLVSVEDVEKSLMKVNVGKAPGPDGIPNWLLRDYAGIVGAPLAAIWNNTMRKGLLPTEWKSAEVIPLAKVTPPQSVENDARPVSLTPTAVKQQESFVYRWLWDVVKDKINPNQYGCVKKSSTTMALVDLFNAWAKETDVLKTTVRVLMIDYRKAFDLIDHNIVLRKLENYGVPLVLLRWVSAFLKNRLQCVRMGKERSGWVELNGGVPQGTKLGPLLYIVMINDLELDLPLVKFMDDSTTYEVIHHPNDTAASVMNQQASLVSTWSKQNNTKLNTKKTKEMQICFSRQPPKLEPIIIDDTEIEVVSQAKLLGVWFRDDLTWHTHVEEIHKKACKGSSMLS